MWVEDTGSRDSVCSLRDEGEVTSLHVLHPFPRNWVESISPRGKVTRTGLLAVKRIRQFDTNTPIW